MEDILTDLQKELEQMTNSFHKDSNINEEILKWKKRANEAENHVSELKIQLKKLIQGIKGILLNTNIT